MKPDIANFAQVDRAPAPAYFVSYLDAASRLEYMKNIQRQMIDRLALTPGSQVLDIGCGPGDRALELDELRPPSQLSADAHVILVAPTLGVEPRKAATYGRIVRLVVNRAAAVLEHDAALVANARAQLT